MAPMIKQCSVVLDKLGEMVPPGEKTTAEGDEAESESDQEEDEEDFTPFHARLKEKTSQMIEHLKDLQDDPVTSRVGCCKNRLADIKTLCVKQQAKLTKGKKSPAALLQECVDAVDQLKHFETEPNVLIPHLREMKRQCVKIAPKLEEIQQALPAPKLKLDVASLSAEAQAGQAAGENFQQEFKKCRSAFLAQLQGMQHPNNANNSPCSPGLAKICFNKMTNLLQSEIDKHPDISEAAPAPPAPVVLLQAPSHHHPRTSDISGKQSDASGSTGATADLYQMCCGGDEVQDKPCFKTANEVRAVFAKFHSPAHFPLPSAKAVLPQESDPEDSKLEEFSCFWKILVFGRQIFKNF